MIAVVQRQVPQASERRELRQQRMDARSLVVMTAGKLVPVDGETVGTECLLGRLSVQKRPGKDRSHLNRADRPHTTLAALYSREECAQSGLILPRDALEEGRM